MWALLAFARREFDRAFTSPSLTESPVDAQTTSETRTLILSAFPPKPTPYSRATTLDPNPTVVVDGHRFYLGTLGGEEVIVGMTGIGMVNATETTEAALDYFTPESGVSIGAVVSRVSPADPDAPRSATWPYRPNGPPTAAKPGMRSMPTCSSQPAPSTVDLAEHRQHRGSRL